MYILTYLFKNSQHAVQLYFDDLNPALEEMNKDGNVKDNYGHIAFIDRPSVGACYVTDMEGELRAQETVEMMKAKAMIRAQNRAKSDPSLMLMNGGRGMT